LNSCTIILFFQHFLCAKNNEARGQFVAFVFRYSTSQNKELKEKRVKRKKPPPKPTASTAAEMCVDDPGLRSAINSLKLVTLILLLI
jgi:hypothetical protein